MRSNRVFYGVHVALLVITIVCATAYSFRDPNGKSADREFAVYLLNVKIPAIAADIARNPRCLFKCSCGHQDSKPRMS